MQTSGLPIGIVKGEGSYLYDENGKRYIDAVSSWWVNIHGHAHPYIANAIAAQAKVLEQVIFAGFTHEPAIKFAEKFMPLLPQNQQKIFLSDNGSTAVEAAIKMALQFFFNQQKPRTKIIAFRDAYHGDTFGSMSVSARGVFTKPFNKLLFDVLFIDTPTATNHLEVIEQFQQHITEHKNEIAAFIFEPLILGSAGMLIYDVEVLNQLMTLAKANNIFCIADEVMTGFGRTGKMFASEYLSVQPDIMCFSKGITGGFMALGATTCTNEIYEAFLSNEKAKMFFHGHSYTGNPLACAAAFASLEVWEQENTLLNVNAIEKLNQEFVLKLRGKEKIENVRTLGTILAFEVKTKEQNIYTNSIRDELYNYFIEKGILLRPLGNTLYVMPPYCISETDLKLVFEVIETL
jgi:adenosylmethionine-8-amino-7-oxononanoate aminotransferase